MISAHTLRGRVLGLPQPLSVADRTQVVSRRLSENAAGTTAWQSDRVVLVQLAGEQWAIGQDLRVRPSHLLGSHKPGELVHLSGASEHLSVAGDALHLGQDGDVRVANFQGALRLVTTDDGDGIVLRDGDEIVAGPQWKPITNLPFADSVGVFDAIPSSDILRSQISCARIEDLLRRLGYTVEEFEGIHGDVLAIDRFLRTNYSHRGLAGRVAVGLEDVLIAAQNLGIDREFIDGYYARRDRVDQRLYEHRKGLSYDFPYETTTEPLQFFIDVAAGNNLALDEPGESGVSALDEFFEISAFFHRLQDEDVEFQGPSMCEGLPAETEQLYRANLGDLRRLYQLFTKARDEHGLTLQELAQLDCLAMMFYGETFDESINFAENLVAIFLHLRDRLSTNEIFQILNRLAVFSIEISDCLTSLEFLRYITSDPDVDLDRIARALAPFGNDSIGTAFIMELPSYDGIEDFLTNYEPS